MPTAATVAKPDFPGLLQKPAKSSFTVDILLKICSGMATDVVDTIVKCCQLSL
jgi:hypothetical protein